MDGIILKDRRMVIPSAQRGDLLKKLHASHMGIEKTKQLARQYYYWPGMYYDNEVWIRSCPTCNANKRKQTKQPLIQHPIPDYPWQKVGCDVFTSRGQDHLIIVDYFSKFAEVTRLKRKTANAIIIKLKTIFSRFGMPETVIADNVPFASAEFQKFARNWNFRIVTSSPNHPQSNGQAERAIQTVKKLMRKAHESGEDIEKAFLHLRATPLSGTSVSPAQLMFNRCIRTDLPAISDSQRGEGRKAEGRKRDELLHKQATERKYADRGSRLLQKLSPGETVRIQLGNQLVPGRVLEELPGAPRTYRVATADGQELRRNRLHLHQTLEKTPHINITSHQEDLVTAILQAGQSCSASHSPPSQANSETKASDLAAPPTENCHTSSTSSTTVKADQTTTDTLFTMNNVGFLNVGFLNVGFLIVGSQASCAVFLGGRCNIVHIYRERPQPG